MRRTGKWKNSLGIWQDFETMHPMEQPMDMSKEDKDKYQAEDDVRTLIKAGEIKADKKRLARAKKLAMEQMGALKDVSA